MSDTNQPESACDPTPGKLHPPRTLFLHQHVGKAEDPETGEVAFEMAVSASDMSPLVFCPATRRYWSLGWNELLAMAEAAGISEPTPEEATTA